jgi:hypothetical protein
MDERERQKLARSFENARQSHSSNVKQAKNTLRLYRTDPIIKQHPRFSGSRMQHGASSLVVAATVADCRTLPSYQHGQRWDQTHEGA